MSQARRFLPSLAIAALVACAVLPARADFGPAQGGGGAAQTPWSTDIDGNGKSLTGVLNFSNTGTTTLGNGAGDTVSLGSTNVLAFGGTSSTFPALRYGSSAGVIEFLRADGSAGSASTIQAGSLRLDSTVGDLVIGENSAAVVALEAGTDLTIGTGSGPDVYVNCGTNKKTTLEYNAADVAYVGSQGLSVVGSNGIALKDQTSAPTVTAGYQGAYSLNTGGLQQFVVKGGSGAVTLATQGYYAAGAHFAVTRVTDQTYTNGNETVSWTAEVADQAGGVDVSGSPTKAFTAPAAGVVWITVKGQWESNASDSVRAITIQHWNSAGVSQGTWVEQAYFATNTNGVVHAQNVVGTFHVAAGDYLTMRGNVPDIDGSPSLIMTSARAEGYFVPD